MKLEFKDVSLELLNKHVSIDKDYKKNVELLMNGKYRLNKGLEIVEFDLYPDWNYEHTISANTYQLYLHTLNFIKSLVKSYLVTNNLEHISYAKKIIENWISHNLYNSESRYIWYDHTVSSRIWNLLFFQANAPREYKIKEKKFMKIYYLHVDFLKKYKNYVENNHGIMMDRALILSSIFLKDKELKEEHILLAKSRIEKAIYRDYSYKNVHLENSPDYHRMVTSWLNRTSKLLNDVGYPLSAKLKRKLSDATKYDRIIVNYNREYPMIGDTGHSLTNVNKLHHDFIDYEAGVAIINNRRTKSTLVFNCGFQNLTHKHYDDLSFTLSIYGEQILVDSGKYNYNKDDDIRQHMLSPKAHTTLFINDKLYDLTKNKKIRMKSYIQLENYKIIKGSNNAYDDVYIDRVIIVVDNDVYVIYDKLRSSTQHIYINNFVFHDAINIKMIGKRAYQLTTPFNKKYILKEHSIRASAVLSKDGNRNAKISRTFNQLINTNRLEIKKNQKRSTFLTSIAPTSKEIENLFFEDGFININIDKKEYKIPIE